MPVAPPEIGPYRVTRPLGRGGMGAVYLAYDGRLGRQVALKLFSGTEATSARARDQLLREARAAAAINHPHIASVHDVLDVEGQVAIVFEFVEGETLAARLKRGRLRPDVAVGVALQLADALAAAHQHGIVHRDLKPANIAVTPEGVVKVLDFGVARVMPSGADTAASARTTAAEFVGTLGYAAPEQCLGQSVDARADVFSLGVVLFELLTGYRPFVGDDAASVVRSMVIGKAPRVQSAVPDIPVELDELIARMLASDPAERPASAREVLDRLRGLAPTEQSPAPPASGSPRRWRSAVLVVAGALVIVVGALIGSISPSSESDAPPVVAVLPLSNATADAGNDHLAAGVGDSLTTSLAALNGITVLSRAAVVDEWNRERQPAKLADALGATYLVEGSVQRSGERIRLSVNLVRPDRSVAWGDSVEGLLEDVFELQSRLAAALGRALSVQVSAAERTRLAQQPTANPEALAAYWQGRALLDRRDVEGNTERALASFEEAVRLDSGFALAHAARGEALWRIYGVSRDPQTAQAAIDAATTALRLDPQQASVRYALGVSLAGTGQLGAAIDELQRALALQPNHDDARRELGNVLARQGRIDEAVAEFRKAIALRPNFAGHYSALGIALLRATRYEEAAEAFTRVTELQPDNASGFQQLGTVYHYLGRFEEAVRNYERAIQIQPSANAYANLGALFHERRDYARAIDAYRTSIQLRPNSAATHRNLGDTYRRLGRSDAARVSYRTAARLAEADLKVNPKNVRTLASLAVILAKTGDRAAIGRLEEARTLAPDDAEVAYFGAVVHALLGEPQDALAALRRALKLGYSRARARSDDDLAGLRGLPEFHTLTKGESE